MSKSVFISHSGVTPADLQGSKLIMPAITMGNVGQLTVDLLISTLKLHRVGFLDEPNIIPIVGNDAFSHHASESGCLSCSAEVFYSKEHNLTIVQQRAPVVKGRFAAYASNLVSWMKECKFADVVLLSSTSAAFRDDEAMRAPLSYLHTPSSHLHEKASTLRWHCLANLVRATATTHEPHSLDYEFSAPTRVGLDQLIKKGGLTRKVYEACQQEGVRFNLFSSISRVLCFFFCQEKLVPLLVSVAYCEEGDNIPDAVQCASQLDGLLNMLDKDTTEWKPPSSWQKISGPAPERSLYM